MNKKAKIVGILIGLLLLVAVGSALAKVTFNSTAASNAGGPPIAGDGILLRKTGLHAVTEDSGLGASNGTHFLTYRATAGSAETFAAVSQAPFIQTRFDVGGGIVGALPQWLPISGLQSDNPWAAAQRQGLPTSFQTYAPNGFTNLRSVSLGSAAGGSSVAVDNPVTTPVPEPETYAMLLGGLGLIGATLRRRKNL